MTEQSQDSSNAPAGVQPQHAAHSGEKASDEEEHAELTTFQCRDAYVYRIPPASTIGHRAELWRVDDWDAEVAVVIATRQEECWVRLMDKASNELFAECPIPRSQPLITVVEPVVDSSRYYVIRIEDRASRRHAFIGLGFRDRSDASNFNAALDDHLQHLRRKKAADAMRQQYSKARQARSDADGNNSNSNDARGGGGTEGDSQFLFASDLAMKPGQTINVSLPWANNDNKSPPSQRMAAMAALARANFVSPAATTSSSSSDSSRRRSTDGSGGKPAGFLLPPPSQRPTFSPRAKPAGGASTASDVKTSTPASAEHRGSETEQPFPFQQDKDESASMAALSLKSVGSGGSSLVAPSSCCPSETGSDGGTTAAAAAAVAAAPNPSPTSPTDDESSGGALRPPSDDNAPSTQSLQAVPPGAARERAEGDSGGDWGDFVAS